MVGPRGNGVPGPPIAPRGAKNRARRDIVRSHWCIPFWGRIGGPTSTACVLPKAQGRLRTTVRVNVFRQCAQWASCESHTNRTEEGGGSHPIDCRSRATSRRACDVPALSVGLFGPVVRSIVYTISRRIVTVRFPHFWRAVGAIADSPRRLSPEAA